VVVLGGMYLMSDYSASIDQQILTNRWDQSGSDEIGRLIVSGLKDDRRSLFGLQLLRTIIFMLGLLALLWLFMKKRLGALAVVIILAIITTVDLLVVDSDYLNEDKYHPKDD